MQTPSFTIGKTTVGQLVDIVADQFGDNIAMEYIETDVRLNFKEFKKECEAFARGLMAVGVKRGENIAIWADNIPEWVFTQFAVGKMGAVLVTVNTNYRTSELEYLLKQSDSTTLITVGGVRKPGEYPEMIREICPEIDGCDPGALKSEKLPNLKNVILIGDQKEPGMYTLAEIIKKGESVSDEALSERQASLDPDDVTMIQYTSGTSGFHKGVMLTHTNLIGNARSVGECMNLTSADKLCFPVPMFHCFGCVLGNLTSVAMGATMVPIINYKPDRVLDAVQKLKCTALHGVPTMFHSELEEMEKGSYDTSSLRTGVMAGAPCPVEVMEKVVSKMGAREMTIAYGQTEASPIITQTRPEDEIDLRVSTVGKALPRVEVKIVDPETGEDLPAGAEGELCARGYNIMKGYYKMEEAGREAVDSDGWLHTGDLAVMDENGYFRIKGVLKNMIIRGGENIYPKEIEEFLINHPKIKGVQVVGIPSRKYGQEVMAKIQLEPGQTSSDEELKAFCKGKIAFHKIPSVFDFVDES